MATAYILPFPQLALFVFLFGDMALEMFVRTIDLLLGGLWQLKRESKLVKGILKFTKLR